MGNKVALITGITGQDGSYMAELLLEKGYEVHGMRRRSSCFNTARIDHIFNKIHVHYGDITDEASIRTILHQIKPDAIYNLAAQSHVHLSFTVPQYTTSTIVAGTLNILNAVRDICPEAHIYLASSSEMYGGSDYPLNEESLFAPRSPYAAAKLCAHHMGKIYRDAYGMWVTRGILFNHESPRRGETFVTRKITRGIASILRKETDVLLLGNLDARRDWGYSPEFCGAMYEMMNEDTPDDYVIGTGQAHTIWEFVSAAFAYAGLDFQNHVKTDKRYIRPLDVDCLIADSFKARRKLGWEPNVTFEQLVMLMVDSDVADNE